MTREQSGLEIGIGRRARRAYGFDEVALVPGGVTLNPDEVDITFSMGDRFRLDIPVWGAAMDGVVDVEFAIAMGKLGGVAVLNLDGVHTRYADSRPIIERIAAADKSTVNAILKEAYREPVKPQLITERIKAIKAAGVRCAVSTVPARADERAELVQKAGADVLELGDVVRATDSERRSQSAGEVLAAIIDAGGAKQDLFQGRFRAHVHPSATRKVRIWRRHAPVVALRSRFLGSGERGADHDRVGA